MVLSVDPTQTQRSWSRNVIHVYAIRGDRYEFLQAFAEKCSFRRLARKAVLFAKRYNAWFVLIENTARGPDLIEELQTRLPAVMIIPVVSVWNQSGPTAPICIHHPSQADQH